MENHFISHEYNARKHTSGCVGIDHHCAELLDQLVVFKGGNAPFPCSDEILLTFSGWVKGFLFTSREGDDEHDAYKYYQVVFHLNNVVV
jgi:hypothetical protein